MDDSNNVDVSLTGATGDLGDDVLVTVRQQVTPITGLIPWAFPSPTVLTYKSTFRLEVATPAWTDSVNQPCP
jgi:hypothetical protein